MGTIEHSFTTHLDSLLSRLPMVRDGDADAIHAARIATRRLRGILPILVGDHPSERWQELQGRFRKTGRSLGKARDVDVSLELLQEIEQRSPATAPAAAAVRSRLMPEQVRRRRRLIKRLERQNIEALGGRRAIGAHVNGNGRALWRTPPAHRRLAAAIATNADLAQDAITHASGVYFPKRAHRVRVALKKLRYLVELLERGDGGRRPALRVLKRAQEALGQIHDREVLAARLKRLLRGQDIPIVESARRCPRSGITGAVRAVRARARRADHDLPGAGRVVEASLRSHDQDQDAHGRRAGRPVGGDASARKPGTQDLRTRAPCGHVVTQLQLANSSRTRMPAALAPSVS